MHSSQAELLAKTPPWEGECLEGPNGPTPIQTGASLPCVQPKELARIVVLRECWLEEILAGNKKLEIRDRALRAGCKFLAARGVIHGVINQGTPFRIQHQAEWDMLREQHLVQDEQMPYTKTWALPILTVNRIQPVPYSYRKGTVGTAKYRRVEDDEDRINSGDNKVPEKRNSKHKKGRDVGLGTEVQPRKLRKQSTATLQDYPQREQPSIFEEQTTEANVREEPPTANECATLNTEVPGPALPVEVTNGNLQSDKENVPPAQVSF